jgi:hypothetical protein
MQPPMGYPPPLATRADIEALGKQFSVSLGTLTRELFSELSKHTDDEIDRWRAHLEVYNKRWTEHAHRLAVRTRLWVAGITALGVVLVGSITTLGDHSYAKAVIKMQETTRVELTAAASAQLAHDELLMKRILDERDTRTGVLIVRGKP